MGKASSSKKVQRAAKAAASSRGTGESRERGFPLLVGVIVLLGIGLVFAARGSRAEAVAPFLDDHWHSAYEVYNCGTLLSPIQNSNDPDGIHTHGNGLIHIHPFNGSATGEDAGFQVFFEATGLDASETTIESGEFAAFDTTTGCGDADSAIKIGRWNLGPDGAELEEVITSDFAGVRFLHEREAFTIAKVAADEDPPPPSATLIAQLDVSTGTTNFAPAPIGDHLHDADEPEEHEHDAVPGDESTDDPASDDPSTDDESPEDPSSDGEPADESSEDESSDGEAEPDSE